MKAKVGNFIEITPSTMRCEGYKEDIGNVYQIISYMKDTRIEYPFAARRFTDNNYTGVYKEWEFKLSPAVQRKVKINV